MAVKFAPLLTAALLAGLFAAPAMAQSADPQPERAFGQKMPQQFLFNRMFSPQPEAAPAEAAASGQAAQGGAAGAPGAAPARQAAQDETNGDSPFPKQYLLNRMFSASSLKDE